jgi:ABC-type Fe3+-siderophore transport system permease subunit
VTSAARATPVSTLAVGLGVLTLLAAAASLVIGRDGGGPTFGFGGPELSETIMREIRLPRTLLALLVGGTLGLCGAALQGLLRNPLAEPGLLGVSGGAGLAAVAAITLVPTLGTWTLAGVAAAGALVACALVFGLAARGGLASDRLVLIGVGVSYGTLSLITVLIVQTDPFNETKALTWLSGSTYGRTFAHLVPVLVALVLATALLARAREELDLMALDDDTPRVLGIALGRTRLMLLGAVLVCLADVLGRTVIAPAQLPAGLLTSVIGTPYFVWLLWRSRARA